MTQEILLMDIPTFLAKYCLSKSKFYSQVKSQALRITKIDGRTFVKRQDAEDWYNNLGN